MKILVVDRRADLRSALVLLLKELVGLEVIAEAGSITEIQEALRVNIPDVVLIDWGIVGKKGKKTLTSIRVYNPGVKIIALDSNEETRQNAIGAGVDEFVTKEFSPDRLVSILNQICLKQDHEGTPSLS